MCLSDLEEYNNYNVSIRANNGAGEGDASMIIVLTLEAGLFMNIFFLTGISKNSLLLISISSS